LEFLSGLFEIPMLFDFVFVRFVKKELDDPFISENLSGFDLIGLSE